MDAFNLDYRLMMQQEHEERKSRNPRYSRRAFARDAGLSPSHLTRVLAGKKSLSRAMGLSIATRLGWTEGKMQMFLATIDGIRMNEPHRQSV
jgi:uncharacterized protein (TIGR02147 family)